MINICPISGDVKRDEKIWFTYHANAFETAIKRAKRQRGMIVAFGFTKDTYEEIARVKKEGIDIIPRTVKELLDMGY